MVKGVNNMTEYKKISFRVDEDTYNKLQEHAKMQYLSLSAYIRKNLDLQLEKKINNYETLRLS